MHPRVQRLVSLRNPPLWSYPLAATATVAVFVVALPPGLDPLPDVALEGVYLLLAAAIAVPIRRFDVGVLEVGWQLFLFGRLIDFLDELFVEPEPLVEPYLSGLVMLASFSVTVLGTYVLLEDRDDRIEELALKDEAMEKAPVGITIADTTDDDDPLTYVNETFTEMTGYGTEEILGVNCRVLQGEETDPERVARMREAIANGESADVTLRNYRADGTRFWNEVLIAPVVDEEGSVPNYVGFQRDVTERETYRRRLEEQCEDLRILNQMVRHDIRNDLQVATGYLELLEEHVDDEGRELLEAAAQSASDAVSLTQTAQELSETMLEEDATETGVRLRPTLEPEIEEARSAFEDATVEVDGTVPDATVRADGMLGSVFRNLLTNAVRHNDKERPEVTVSATEGDERIVVRIADNGPGVPDDRKEDIFGRGEQGLESEGTGIGAYLADTLVTRYGGEVWVEDVDPEGAVFNVALPTAS